MTIRCALLDDYQQVALSAADWSVLPEVDVVSVAEHLTDEEQIVAAVQDCQIVVIMRERTPFTASLFARLPQLRLLVTTGRRNAAVDLSAAAAHGVIVSGTDSLVTPTAELTWALILGLARNVTQENANLRQGGWQLSVGNDLAGARLGVLGLGRLGGQVATIGRAFGMQVSAWSQNLTDQRCEEVGVRRAASKADLVGSSDFLTIHLVLSDRTRHLVGAAELEAMPPAAYLINTSRAGIVDTGALLAQLRSGGIAGAGIDVFDVEPVPDSDELVRHPRVLATPHLGYVTKDNYRVFYRDAVDDIRAFLSGSPVRLLT